jgi:hypothetical protein
MTQTEPQEAAPAAGSEAVADFKKSLMDQVRAHRKALQLFPREVLSTHPTPPRRRQGQHRLGTQIPGSHLPHPQKQLGVRGLPQLRPGLLKEAKTQL